MAGAASQGADAGGRAMSGPSKVRITWLWPEERVEHEIRQLREEGVDPSSLAAAWAEARREHEGDLDALRTRALALLDAAAELSEQQPEREPPASLTEALASRGDPSQPAGGETPRRFARGDLADRLLGAWHGRLAGCLLGKPVEKIPREGIREILQSVGEWPLRRYFTAEGVPPEVAERWPWNRASRPTSLRENIDGMPEDDDVNYSLIALHLLETHGDAFDTGDVATTWLKLMPPLTVFTAERVAVENLLAYVEPPETARVRNPYREWIGAQIRADVWGWVRPGDPAAAAELAWRDARLSHVENGVYAEMLVAAMIAAAFVESDPASIVASGLSVVPAGSRLAEVVRWAADLAAATAEWEAVLDQLHARLGRYHWVHAINNCALVVAALVHGGGDFEPSVTKVVMGGWDTDSNGATVGSITGVIGGSRAIPAAWTAPLRNRLSTSLKGFDQSRIDDLAARTLAQVPDEYLLGEPAAAPAASRTSAPTPADGPLAGLRVLDLATMMAAPWAATFLADYGADVIKVERPGEGDHARAFGLQKDGEPVFWKSLGRNKRSLALDLKSEGGREVLLRLVEKADVVIENFRPGVLDRLGLGFERLRQANRRLILLSVTGYGQDGPYADRAGFGTLIEAMSGFAWSNGEPDGPPILPAIPLADGVAGVFGALAAMVAVFERDVRGSGEGQHIDLSLFEPLARLLEGHVLEHEALGIVRQRLGNRSLTSAPRNAYRSADGGWVALSASAQPVFERLARAIGRVDLLSDPRFGTNHDRIQHAEALDEIVGAWLATRPRDEAIAELARLGAAVGPIYDIAELLRDPHVAARGSFETHEDPVLGPLRVPAVTARLSRTPGRVRYLGQALGESTDEVLREIGYRDDEIRRLRETGAVE